MFIHVEDGVKKARVGKYIVYNAEWFKEHFEQERKLYGKKGKWIKAIDPDNYDNDNPLKDLANEKMQVVKPLVSGV